MSNLKSDLPCSYFILSSFVNLCFFVLQMASQVLKDLNAEFKVPVYSTLCFQYTALEKKKSIHVFHYIWVYLTESLMPSVVMVRQSQFSFVILDLSLEPQGGGGHKTDYCVTGRLLVTLW